MKRRKREKKEGTHAGARERAMPPAFLLQDDAYVARGTVVEGGVPLLVYKIALPCFSEEARTVEDACPYQGNEKGAARMDAFYARVAGELWRGVEGQLFPFVQRAFGESEDPHKRYRFARYTLTVDFSLEREAGRILLSRRALLSRRGKVLCERVWRESFREKDGRIIMGRISGAFVRVKPKKGLKETLKAVISRHTGPH